MSYAAFSHDWVLRWREELRSSDTYRAAAATWEGSLVLAMTSGGEGEIEQAVFLDLWHGECRDARLASEDDRAQADFVITAPTGTWKRVLDGELESIFALMSGKLKLERGSLAKLAPQAAAARELVSAAARIDTVFPTSEAARSPHGP